MAACNAATFSRWTGDSSKSRGVQIEIEIRIKVGLEMRGDAEGGSGEHLSFHGEQMGTLFAHKEHNGETIYMAEYNRASWHRTDGRGS